MKMSGLKPGARNIGRSSARAQEAAGFARKLDNAERGEGRPRAWLSLSLWPVLCSVAQIRRKIPPKQQPTN